MNVLITGGAGYLGCAILRRAQRDLRDWRITVFSRDETKQDECRRRYPEARYVLGDVRDRDRLETAMVGHEIVIHAAAMKYVPEAELNVMECIAVNVDGSRNVAQAAVRAGVRRVVGISTDKAVEPINTYGMSKALMERIFGEMGRHIDTTFTTVRYGNVVGSTGSVIPLFQRQAREQGRVSVTDPTMTRFWMSPDEAIDCILFALGSERVPGSVTVPRPKAMTIGRLAECIAGEAPVDVVGVRPGEKMHESLIHQQESVRVVHFGDFEPGVRAQRFYEISPVSARPFTVGGRLPNAFTVASNAPPGGWVTDDEMLAMIEDAADV